MGSVDGKQVDWRFAAIGGATAGVAISALFHSAPRPATALATLGPAACLLVASRPGPRSRRASGHLIWLGLLALLACGAGIVEGTARLAAIDGGAFGARPGERLSVTATVDAVPRRVHGFVRVRVRTARGPLLIEAREPVANLPAGAEVRASGVIRAPPPWAEGYLRRYGIRVVLSAGRIELTGHRRSGWRGAIDGIRGRAEAALGRSVPAREAALARGFVLGQDDRIDQGTVEDFKRSGLAHLLAVSGENVLLLALLAAPILGLAGVAIRPRLFCILALIGIYVAVTGAGPSIQRAGVMGAAGVVAALAGRTRSRAYAVLLAALVTLAANPRAGGDPGWQLSFAAVLGIILWTGPLRDVLGALLPRLRTGGHVAKLLLEGAAVTSAATLATAPLMAHTFEAVPAASLPANLLALPAVAPSMWLGMLAAMGGQIPGVPVEPLNWLNSLLLAYVAQVAHWCAAPGWALVPVRIGSWPAVGAAYLALAVAVAVCGRAARRRLALVLASPGRAEGRPGRSAHRRLLAVAVALVAWLAVAGPGAPLARPGHGAPGRDQLRLELLDVGQGDAILLRPGDGAPILVDGGPHGDGLRQKLAGEGVHRLAAAVVTHDQADHAGGIEDALGGLDVGALVYGEPSRDLLAAAAAAGVRAVHAAEGSELRSGALRLEVLWPPRDAPAIPGGDPNERALVLLARWHDFAALLTADAEAESVPLDPGPIDVLKVAHHGSADEGLEDLLQRTAPRLALISVGKDNSYGHPAPETLARLSRHHVPVLRTDMEGTVRIEVDRRGWSVDG